MAHVNEDDALAREELVGSTEALVTPAAPTGSSNSRALKIAGLTTLACLLLCTQAFTAYMVFDQKQQIQTLKVSSDRMARMLARPAPPAMSPVKMALPMNTLPLTMDFIANSDTKTSQNPTAEPPQTAVVSVEQQLKDLMKDFKLPEFKETFVANLQSLRQQMNTSDWQSFQTWMQHWLVFRMAQLQKPAPVDPKPAPKIRTKCQLEAEPALGKMGRFRPQCDDLGAYKRVQCWDATGYCWCVNESGEARKDTVIRGQPDCDKGQTTTPGQLVID